MPGLSADPRRFPCMQLRGRARVLLRSHSASASAAAAAPAARLPAAPWSMYGMSVLDVSCSAADAGGGCKPGDACTSMHAATPGVHCIAASSQGMEAWTSSQAGDYQGPGDYHVLLPTIPAMCRSGGGMDMRCCHRLLCLPY